MKRCYHIQDTLKNNYFIVHIFNSKPFYGMFNRLTKPRRRSWRTKKEILLILASMQNENTVKQLKKVVAEICSCLSILRWNSKG